MDTSSLFLISIVIPTRDLQAFSLKECLYSIEQQGFSKENLEVLVVVNGETERGILPSPFSKESYVRVYSVKGGVGRARNYGLSLARGELIYLLDDDCILPHANFLSFLKEQYHKYKSVNPELKIFGGGYLSDNQTTYWGRSYNEVVNGWLEDHGQSLVAGNWIMDRSCVEAGLFPELDDFGGEEFRALKKIQEKCEIENGRWLLKDFDLSVYHRSRHNFSSFVSRAILHGSAKFRFDSEGLLNGRGRMGQRRIRIPVLIYYGGVFLGYMAEFFRKR